MPKDSHKILIHTCCAACASYLILELEKEGRECVLSFYNPNLNHLEYHYRLAGIRELAEKKGLKLMIPHHDQEVYLTLVEPYQNKKSIKFVTDKERLKRKLRDLFVDKVLRQVVAAAKEMGIPVVTTSMLCSPYRDHNTVWDFGLGIAGETGVEFYYKDFRKGYWMGRNLARSNNLAIPAYCSDYME